MSIDYVRIYQPKDDKGVYSVTCDPPGYGTTQYIADHPIAYLQPNFTHWSDTGYEWPPNTLMGCDNTPTNTLVVLSGSIEGPKQVVQVRHLLALWTGRSIDSRYRNPKMIWCRYRTYKIKMPTSIADPRPHSEESNIERLASASWWSLMCKNWSMMIWGSMFNSARCSYCSFKCWQAVEQGNHCKISTTYICTHNRGDFGKSSSIPYTDSKTQLPIRSTA